ncbi:MAG TPA: hypothetical protein VGQ24_02635, partial [Gemmatimonadales bacterium]|nr:hypothetical protein [Gemmatimonadales bacterium]
MAENRIIQLILKAKDEATAVLSKAESGIDSFGRKATGVFKAVAALAVTAALGKFFADAVEEGAKAELGIARLGTAVRNAGGDFKALRPSLEEAIEGVRKLTTYTDDDLRAALTNLITVTGDTSGSVKNLGVVADLAAFKQISLEEASLSVAKAMNGNVTQLNKLGIAGKDSNTVLENLRATVGGFAAGEATTFSGRLTQLNNEWGEFKEAVGTAIISSGEAGGAVGKLTAVMVDLEHWVTANQASISAFVGGVVDLASWVGGQLADLFRGIQIFAVDLALAWDTAGANLRGTLGRILMAFSEFLGQNRVLL